MDNLVFFASLYGMSTKQAKSRARELLSWVELLEKADLPVWTYSTGMQQRLSIARALLHEPKILLFDEITRGLDLGMKKRVLALIRRLVDEHGKTVLLASHDMDAIKETADEVWLITKGELKGHGDFNKGRWHRKP
jgi:ABC-2 type transport system ATP-binding protein